MKKYIKNATAVADEVRVDTPYNSYEFDSEEEAQEFFDYVNADPDYDDPKLGDVVEHCFFLNRESVVDIFKMVFCIDWRYNYEEIFTQT